VHAFRNANWERGGGRGGRGKARGFSSDALMWVFFSIASPLRFFASSISHTN